jgi:ABC-type lipoprotein export system ATPase subunit
VVQKIMNTFKKMATLRIEIGGTESKAFKSIDRLVWDEIPGLAILTGVNGSGKSQLLELLAYKLTNTHYLHYGDILRQTKVTVTGDSFGPDSVAYLPSSAEIPGSPALGLAQLQQAKAQLYQQLQPQNVANNLSMRAKRSRIEKTLGVTNLNQLTQEDFVKGLPDDFSYLLEEIDVVGGLCHVFVAHRARMHEELERGIAMSDLSRVLGPAPWDVVNETLTTAEFSYSVVSPLKTRILDSYELRLVNNTNGVVLPATDLSSGEKAILKLILWLYNSKHHNRFPKLFLLDEPDAHLHPAMTRQFLNVIKEVLVEKYGVRVILCTHSPSTVALAPEGSVFEMSKSDPRIAPSKSIAHSVGLLTAGLVTVSRGTRFVFVEDDDDVNFYSTVRDILTDAGPSRDVMAVDPVPSLVFLAASLRRGTTNQSGGKDAVQRWVQKFDKAPLNELFRGIIDRDSGNAVIPRVHVIGRYSFENYLLDPVLIFAVAVGLGRAPPVVGVKITAGDEHQLRNFDQASIQAIVDAICASVEVHIPNLTPADATLSPVVFTNGITVQYPHWMLNRRGHDLLPEIQKAFGGPQLITPPALCAMLRRVRLIPVELAQIIRALQN